MPKISYGPIAKQRTLALLMALVDYGNDELDVEDDASLDRLRSQLTLHWTTDRQLIVRTKIRNLETLMCLASSEQGLSKVHIKTALHHLEHHLGLLEDNRTSRRGSDVWHFTLTLWHHRRDRNALLQTFDQTWECNRCDPSAAPDIYSPEPHPEPTDLWQQYCQQALTSAAQGLTLNLFNPSSGSSFGRSPGTRVTPNDLHRPLALVEHVPDLADQSSKQISEIKTVATSELLNHIQHHTIQKLAIVGEPGAGKTTLLQQLAQQILQQTSDLPIIVPLAYLGATSLEDYILQDWLKLALGQHRVDPDVQNTLADHIEQGRGWLLLDAIDEMDQSGSLAITRLAQQFQGWLRNGRIIITCRLNLWDAGKNTLGHWPTYRLLGYEDYRGQIQPFICRWFASQPELGTSLCQHLSLPEHNRLRNNLRNPLRLALFCRLGSSGQLPTTQHQLYQQFVTALYDWQQDTFPTTLLEQHCINQVLSKLAIATLNTSTVQVNLSQVTQTLQTGEFPWFERAIQLGWLMPVVTSTGEKLYGFLHSTFRDYFAAQAIDHWQTLTSIQNGQLPMVLPRWQAVILLWLGRSDIAHTDKDDLINALITFNDNCGHFFEHRAWLLAGRALGEYPECPQAETIIQQLMTWRFNLTRKTSPILIESAKAALAESDLSRVTAALTQLAQDASQDLFDRWMAAYSLGRSYDPQNPVAIETLEILLSIVRSDYLKMDIARHLGMLSPRHPLAIATLVDIINTHRHPLAKRKAAIRLAKVVPEHPLPVTTLEQLLAEAPQDKNTLNALLLLSPNHPRVLAMNASLAFPVKAHRRVKTKMHGQPDISKLIRRLTTRLEIATSDRTRLRLAHKLIQLQPGHPAAIDALWQCIISTQDKNQHKSACETLQSAITDTQIPNLVSQLRPFYAQALIAEHKEQQLAYFKLLWTWSDILGYSAFCNVWQGTESSRYADVSFEKGAEN